MLRREARKLGKIELRNYTEGQKEVLKTYSNMVRQKAWTYWRKLPLTVKSWIDPEDLIEDGLRWATTRGYDRWSVRKGGNFGTFLWHGLENFFNERYVSHFSAEMRCDLLRDKTERKNYKILGNRLVSIEAAAQKFGQQGKEFEMERAFRIETKEVDFLTSCYAVDYLIKLYGEASTQLQTALVRWFIRPPSGDRREDSRRYFKQLAGARFVENSREFKGLAHHYRLDIHDCQHIMGSPECLDKLSREWIYVPYNLDDPIPGKIYQPRLPIFRRD